jgi:prepilin-type N-terminal cleavage/methylation domain-containing protein
MISRHTFGSHPTSAFTLLELLVAISIIGTLMGLTLAGVQRVRWTAARIDCTNRLRQIAIAAHQYHNSRRSLPSGVTYENGASPQPFMSWSVRLLPYLEDEARWHQAVEAFKVNKNFQAVPPHFGYQTPMKIYACPMDARVLEQPATDWGARTSYLGVVGSKHRRIGDGVIYLDSRVSFEGITDGLSNTLMIGERPPSQ